MRKQIEYILALASVIGFLYYGLGFAACFSDANISCTVASGCGPVLSNALCNSQAALACNFKLATWFDALSIFSESYSVIFAILSILGNIYTLLQYGFAFEVKK